jgi:hypothetical protein
MTNDEMDAGARAAEGEWKDMSFMGGSSVGPKDGERTRECKKFFQMAIGMDNEE